MHDAVMERPLRPKPDSLPAANTMTTDTISSETARRFYDWLGEKHDWGGRFERRAKERALELLEAGSAQQLLNVGVGTGKEQQTIQAVLPPGGQTFGIDLSGEMLKVTQQRVPETQLSQAMAWQLPFASGSFDRVFCTYVLDLFETAVLPQTLSELHRVLQPGGKLILVSLTEGINLPSRLLVGLWKTTYRLHPLILGGCRPLRLQTLVEQAGFSILQREVIVQLGVPSEVILTGR
ncbi:class I SAM-dependent methyltransferase [Candidatus Leptofilum sp.]|uniref:class I SAM-dependent methyltransferase n=1 Tax=Candidatus Leptofilum sp. TaxID=3241576 RepID=UPI003B5A15F6